MHFRRPQRSHTCISVVHNNGIRRVMLSGEGRSHPEYTYLNWEFEQGEQVEEGLPYRVVILPDPRSTGNIMKKIVVAIAILLVSTVAQARDMRPRAWCGWYARHLVRHDPGPAYNLARNWARWGRAAHPAPGVMVVWRNHVGMITGRDASGNWIVRSGNDGHRVRERPRSIARAIAFRAG